MNRSLLLAGVAAGLLLAGTASAGSLGGPNAPTLDLYLNSWHGTDTGAPSTGTTFDYDGVQNTANWSLSWNVNLDPDPFLNGAFSVTNNTAGTQSYILTVILPISPSIPGGTLVGGSIGGSVTDSNNNGVATLTATGLFEGQIDGATALLITPAGGPSWSAPFAGGTTTIPAANVGLPGPTIPSFAAATNIAIRLQFSLTSGDSASFTSFFVVEPIPEPATALLLGLGIGGLVFAGRRRA